MAYALGRGWLAEDVWVYAGLWNRMLRLYCKDPARATFLPGFARTPLRRSGATSRADLEWPIVSVAGREPWDAGREPFAAYFVRASLSGGGRLAPRDRSTEIAASS
jgi:hypothetical protein